MQPTPFVCIVDDDPAALQSVDALLAAFKYEVRAFRSAEEFLAANVKADRGCLLCDIRLPGISGIELQSRLAQQGYQLPVILISGYADSEMVTEALNNGVVAVLEKPVVPATLIQSVQTAIEMSQA